jgi:hypothetical protein
MPRQETTYNTFVRENFALADGKLAKEKMKSLSVMWRKEKDKITAKSLPINPKKVTVEHTNKVKEKKNKVLIDQDLGSAPKLKKQKVLKEKNNKTSSIYDGIFD